MKALPLFLLALAAAAALPASPVYTVFSVSGVQRSADDVYFATVSTNAPPCEKGTVCASGSPGILSVKGTATFANGATLIITTKGCTHIPAAGAGGIVVTGPTRALIFSDGPSCRIDTIASN